MIIEALVTFQVNEDVSDEFLRSHDLNQKVFDNDDYATVAEALKNEIHSRFETLNIGTDSDFDNMYGIVGD